MTIFNERNGSCVGVSDRYGPCKASAAYGNLCWKHGASDLRGPLGMSLDHGHPMVFECDDQGRPTSEPCHASKYAITEWAKRGVLRHGRFTGVSREHVWNVEKLLKRLRSAGVHVELVKMGLVRVYRFGGESRASCR